LILTLIVLVAVLCFFAWLCTTRRAATGAQLEPLSSQPVSSPTLLVLLGPFTLAYLALLLPRGLSGDLFDRYLLPLLPVGIIFLLRLYQDRVRPNLPSISYAIVLLFGLYAIAGTRDAFSMYRARQAAVAELRSAGIPDTAIDAGFEHNAMAQIDSVGYIAGPHNDEPAAWAATHAVLPCNCQTDHGWLTPAVVPSYTLSWDPNACGGPAGFTAVTWRDWLLGFRNVSIYIVRTAKPAPAQP
jgi:hypothetical protein